MTFCAWPVARPRTSLTGPCRGLPRRDVAAAAQASGRAPGELMAGWFDRPMRWVQLTLVENDPGRFDPQFWLDYFKRLHADAATLSAGGIVAYYPTEVPLHHRSAWLGSSDPFGTLVKGCRDLRHARRGADRPARGARRGAAGASGLDRGEPRRAAGAALGQPGAVGHVRARSLQLRLHGPGASRDRHAIPDRRHLRQPLGAAGRRLLLRALPAELQGRDRARAAAHEQPARRGAAAVSRMAHQPADRAVEALGRDRAGRQRRRRASFPTARRA